MKILILGGTLFLGRHLVDVALSQNHEVTLFHRGKTNRGLYPQVETIYGDRTQNLSLLAHRSWDLVVDTCGYTPKVVQQSAQFLAERVENYTFISSISVYSPPFVLGMTESAPLEKLPTTTSESVTNETYGALKAACEQEVERYFPQRALHVRAGFIVGPYDPSDRFTYWVRRISQGGEIFAPGNPKLSMQFIDARDLALWILKRGEKKQTGVYNVTGPKNILTVETFFKIIQEVTQSDAQFTWISDSFIEKKEVTTAELPLWLPEGWEGMSAMNLQKVLQTDIAFRPTAETIQDTFTWDQSRLKNADSSNTAMKAGLLRTREGTLLKEWHQEKSQTSLS